MDRGKLLLSTKEDGRAWKKVAALWGIFMGVFFLIVCVVVNNVMAQAVWYDKTQYDTMHFLSLAVIIVLGIWMALIVCTYLKQSESYCDVYENVIIGKSGPSSVGKITSPVQDFCFTYDEILNVTESKNILTLYTEYTSVSFIAITKRAEIVQALRSKIEKEK